MSNGHNVSSLPTPPQPPLTTSPTFLKHHTPKLWAFLSHLCSLASVSFKTLERHCPVDWVPKPRNIIYMIHNLNTFKDYLFIFETESHCVVQAGLGWRPSVSMSDRASLPHRRKWPAPPPIPKGLFAHLAHSCHLSLPGARFPSSLVKIDSTEDRLEYYILHQATRQRFIYPNSTERRLPSCLRSISASPGGLWSGVPHDYAWH